MNTDELSRIYRSFDAGDDSVRRVLDAVRDATAEAPRRRFRVSTVQVVAVSAVVLVVLIVGVVFATFGPGDHRPGPAGHSTTSSPPSVVLPPKQPDTVSGAVLDRGRPVAGAYVQVALDPNQQIEAGLKVGQVDPQKRLPMVRSDEHGGFVVRLTHADIVDPDVRQDDYINFEIDVFVGDRMATWNETFQIRADRVTPVRMVFDFGARTIVVDGQKSVLPLG